MNSASITDFQSVLDGRGFSDVVNSIVAVKYGQPLTASCFGPLRERCAAALFRAISDNVGSQRWLYLRISDPSQGQSGSFENALRSIDRVIEAANLSGTWWLAKYDVAGNAIRLRIPIQDADSEDKSAELSLMLTDVGLEVASIVYEPELALFGGEIGLDLAHRLFAADSRCLLAWFKEHEYRRPCSIGFSFALITHLLQCVALDPFECMDVWVKVWGKRRPRSHSSESVSMSQNLSKSFSKILASDLSTLPSLFPEALQGVVAQSFVDYQSLGRELASAHHNGRLGIGLRSFLCTAVLFHWNRAGFPPGFQAATARSAIDAYSTSCQLDLIRLQTGVADRD